jgi:AcrR family transcriptional regulator
MTKEDIVKAAFKVWGRELYKTTSLHEIALELGVSKDALYRHFKDKDALLDAMFIAFFDDCASFIKKGCEEAAGISSQQEAHLVLLRTVAEYYIRRVEAFVFSFFRVYSSQDRDRKNIAEEFLKRGINFANLIQAKTGNGFYPSTMQLLFATLFFYIAEFHRSRHGSNEAPQDGVVKGALARIKERIEKGLKLDAGRVAALNYEALEKQVAGAEYEDTEDNALLRAVAEAVAEAGPWDASMEMVAKRSGLSKSGLYAHFKNKQDMLTQLFMTEFSRIINAAKLQIETTESPEAQLYLAISSIVYYLRSRPEILIAIDWIKTRNLGLDKGASGHIFRAIKSLKLEAIRNLDPRFLAEIAQWLIFMIANTLAWWPAGPDKPRPGKNIGWLKNTQEIPNESFRFLFRFIALGLEGVLS